MNLGKLLYVKNRTQWRSWLRTHHNREKEIWLVYYKKNSGKPRIPYNDAVEEALCYGWIDSTVKAIDHHRFAQRFTPRKPGSPFSDMNKERIRRLIGKGKMTRVGLATAQEIVDSIRSEKKSKSAKFTLPADIQKIMRQDLKTWNNFMKFPLGYKRIRIGWIDAARHRPEIFQQRLRYFIKMTSRNKRFGMVQ